MFTLDLTKLFGIWVPLFVGLVAIAEHLKPISPGYVTTPVATFWFHFLSVFFICWPCAGNLGIICGFCLLLPSLVAFLMIFICPSDCRTVFGFGPDKWSWVDSAITSSGSGHEYHRVETKEVEVRSSKPKESSHTKTTHTKVETSSSRGNVASMAKKFGAY